MMPYSFTVSQHSPSKSLWTVVNLIQRYCPIPTHCSMLEIDKHSLYNEIRNLRERVKETILRLSQRPDKSELVTRYSVTTVRRH